MKARPPKISDRDPATLTNGAINTEVSRLDKASSDVNAAMIEAGYGDLKPSDIYADPRLLHIPVIGWYRKITDRLQRLHYEKEQRMGSRWPGQLPRGKARITGNPTMPRKKAKRKATPAQLRALAKGRATLKRNRKRKAPKRKRVARKNPAYANYQKARQIARGSRAANPVRKLAPLYALTSGSRYFDGARFSAKVVNAARFSNLQHATKIARLLADTTGKSVRIVDLRK